MTDQYGQAERAAAFLRGRMGEMPSLGLVLGSGLGDFTASLGEAVSIAVRRHSPLARVGGDWTRRQACRRNDCREARGGVVRPCSLL